MKKQVGIAIGLTGLLLCSSANAAGFSFTDLIQSGQLLSELDDIPSKTATTVTLNDGSQVNVRSPDGSTPLNQLFQTQNATVLIDGNEVSIGTSAASLASAYDDSSETATFTVSSVADSRPVTLTFNGSLDQITNGSSFNATVNGQPVTLQLPTGTTLADFDSATPVTILDGNGNQIFSGQLNSLSSDGVNELASELGVLSLDQSLRGAQKQAMAQNFGLIANQIDAAMTPSFNAYSRNAGEHSVNVWIASEYSDVAGSAGGDDYDGSSDAAFAGVDRKYRNVLFGIAAGDSDVELTTSHNGGHTKLGGTVIAPYTAVSLLDDTLVLDAIGMYQELDGTNRNDYLAEDIDLDGDRWGGRASATYFLPRFRTVQTGLTAGGAYLKDDLDGTYLGSTSDYGIELGEVFGGVKLATPLPMGRIYASLIYYNNVTTDVDNSANVLDEDDNRTELRLGVSHALGKNLDLNLAGRTVLGSSDTEYSNVQGTLSYQF